MYKDFNLFYKTIEEKKEELSITNYNPIYDYILKRVIHKIDTPTHSLVSGAFTVVKYNLPIKFRESEYFLFYYLDPHGLYIMGNKLERKYLEDFCPEIFIIENRNDIIDDIIGSSS
jgi:hypothetical protein